MIIPSKPIPQRVSYSPRPHETPEYLKMFFEVRIDELEKIKKKLSNDQLGITKEIEAAKKGQSRFSMEYLESFYLKLSEQIKDVDDNITINRYHLFGDVMQ